MIAPLAHRRAAALELVGKAVFATVEDFVDGAGKGGRPLVIEATSVDRVRPLHGSLDLIGHCAFKMAMIGESLISSAAAMRLSRIVGIGLVPVQPRICCVRDSVAIPPMA
jgi:hypothetical protein